MNTDFARPASDRTLTNIDTFIAPAPETGGITLRPFSAGTLTVFACELHRLLHHVEAAQIEVITRPSGRGSAAKKAGEGAIIADLARVMVAAARKKGVKLGDPAEIHKRLRDPHTGRINPRSLKSPYPVDASALRALKRDLLKRVGELAAGWNAGAQKLGVKLPAWVARHGST
jgi:hypothetical protein